MQFPVKGLFPRRRGSGFSNPGNRGGMEQEFGSTDAPRSGDWESLGGLSKAQTVKVYRRDGKLLSGTVQDVDDSSSVWGRSHGQESIAL